MSDIKTAKSAALVDNTESAFGYLATLFADETPVAYDSTDSASSPNLDLYQEAEAWPIFLQLIDSTCLQADFVPAGSNLKADGKKSSAILMMNEFPEKKTKSSRPCWLGWIALATAGVVVGALAAGRSCRRR